MPLVIAAVGRIKEPGLRELVDDYYRRVRRYVPIDEHEVRESGAGATGTRTGDEKTAAALLRAIPAGAHVVALEVEGSSFTSDRFARWLDRRLREGKGSIVFVIGGADGIPRAVSQAAAERLSLSSMTLPHRLARVLLAEQIYRAFTILRGEPYPR